MSEPHLIVFGLVFRLGLGLGLGVRVPANAVVLVFGAVPKTDVGPFLWFRGRACVIGITTVRGRR